MQGRRNEIDNNQDCGDAYLLVTNRSEKNASLTVQGSERFRAEVPCLHKSTEENGDMLYNA